MSIKKKLPEIASALNIRLEQFMPVLTPTGVILGFLLPQLFIQLRPLVPWLFALMTLSGALKLRTKDLVQAVRYPIPIVLFFLCAHLIIPLIVLLTCTLIFRGDSDTISGYMLLFSVPTAVSGFIWVSIFRGDGALTLAIILLDTLVAPLVVPGTLSLFLGTKITLDISGMAVSLILMVVAPTIIGVLVNEGSQEKIPPVVSPYLNPLAKVCVVLVIAANTSPVAPRIHLDTPKVWIIAVLCILFSVLGYVCSRLTGIVARLNPEKKVSLFFTIGMRNISAATTIAIDFFPEAAAFPALLGIVFQQTIAAIMGRLLLRKPKA
ncbi:MAG: bile acid:sodium symporter family protein [Treponema sp.]|jgi:predicted Na+-dependent transporter|nr:bile acid:sodium symporter family protein [Treponema sp.]